MPDNKQYQFPDLQNMMDSGYLGAVMNAVRQSFNPNVTTTIGPDGTITTKHKAATEQAANVMSNVGGGVGNAPAIGEGVIDPQLVANLGGQLMQNQQQQQAFGAQIPQLLADLGYKNALTEQAAGWRERENTGIQNAIMQLAGNLVERQMGESGALSRQRMSDEAAMARHQAPSGYTQMSPEAIALKRDELALEREKLASPKPRPAAIQQLMGKYTDRLDSLLRYSDSEGKLHWYEDKDLDRQALYILDKQIQEASSGEFEIGVVKIPEISTGYFDGLSDVKDQDLYMIVPAGSNPSWPQVQAELKRRGFKDDQIASVFSRLGRGKK